MLSGSFTYSPHYLAIHYCIIYCFQCIQKSLFILRFQFLYQCFQFFILRIRKEHLVKLRSGQGSFCQLRIQATLPSRRNFSITPILLLPPFFMIVCYIIRCFQSTILPLFGPWHPRYEKIKYIPNSFVKTPITHNMITTVGL